MSRDPIFLIVKKDRYMAGVDQPNLILFNTEGDLILRSTESLLNKFEGTVEILRYPEFFQLISAEKFEWKIYITTERIIFANNLNSFKGLFEFMDHLDNNSTLTVVESTNTVNLNEMFKIVDKKKKEMNDYVLAFQIAYTRLSSISVTKVESKKNGKPVPGGIEIWYKDSSILTDSQITIYPANLSFEDPYKHALHIHTEALKEKLKCVERKKEIDPNFTQGDYNSWKSILDRLYKKPDLLAQGSGDLHSESWDPLIFQSHPIQWLSDVFSHSIKASDKVHLST